MSSISGLKDIDKQKAVIINLLDAFDIDIDPDDGSLYPSGIIQRKVPLTINNKTLRMEIGKPKIGVNYTNFNPLSRQDHAQYVYQLSIYLRLFNGELSEEEAYEEADNIVFHVVSIDHDDEMYLCTIRNTDTDVECSAKHSEKSMATLFAVLDYLVQTEELDGEFVKSITGDINEAYEEYKEISELSASERKAI
jgi:hypothetical protein